MRSPFPFPCVRVCRVDDIRADDGSITISLTSTRATATCPSCRRRSRHPHSRYRHRVADQPWAGQPVALVLQLLDPYKEYLLGRWDEGCRNAMQLWREIRARGFAYSSSLAPRIHASISFWSVYRPM